MKLSEKAQAALDAVVRKFREGDLHEMVQALTIQPAADAPSSRWTFANRAMLAAQKHTTDARGFNQWREVGRKVKKGATAGYIFAPMTKRDGEDTEGKAQHKLSGWQTIPVFAAQDTEPIDADDPRTLTYSPRHMPPLADVAAQLGVSVAYAPLGAKFRGSYWPENKEIVLHVTSHRTFWHELAHAAHHHADVADFLPGDHSPETRAYREAVAELTAAVLGELYGEPSAGTSYAYLTTYYPDPLIGITKALTMVGKVLDLITTLAEAAASATNAA